MPLRRQLLLCFLVLLTLVSACEPDALTALEAESHGLRVTANIRSMELDPEDGKATYRATTTVTNQTDDSRDYSNAWLWLETGTAPGSRAYLDSLASHHVDISTIELGPNETLNLEVYWVFPISGLEEPSDDSLVLVLRPEA